jgi:hypothetical protein
VQGVPDNRLCALFVSNSDHRSLINRILVTGKTAQCCAHTHFHMFHWNFHMFQYSCSHPILVLKCVYVRTLQ